MSRVRDFGEDAGTLLLAFFLIKLISGRGVPWWQPKYSDKGGRKPGPGATTTPVPQGATSLWSEETMRLFERTMREAGIDPRVALLGVAAASNFNADEFLGDNVGLLMVRREHLSEVGYPGVPTFEELDAPHQIPWIAKVIAYRLASTGGRVAPTNVGDLAVLLNPISNPTITDMLRSEGNRRAAEAEASMLYIAHKQLLQHVIANPRS